MVVADILHSTGRPWHHNFRRKKQGRRCEELCRRHFSGYMKDCSKNLVGLFGSCRHSSFHRASLAPQFQAKKTRSSVRRTVQKALLGLHERLFKEFEHMDRRAGALQHENMQLFLCVLMLSVVTSREHALFLKVYTAECVLTFTLIPSWNEAFSWFLFPTCGHQLSTLSFPM